MFSQQVQLRSLLLAGGIALCLAVPSAYAVTQYLDPEERNVKFVRNMDDLKASLLLPVFDTVENITIPIKKLKIRVRKGGPLGVIDPMSLMIPKDEDKIAMLAKKIARPNKTDELKAAFIERLKKIGPTQGASVKIDVSPEEFNLMDPEKLATLLGKPHHKVTIDTDLLLKQPSQRTMLMEQIAGFLSRGDLDHITEKFRYKNNLLVDTDLLPAFPRKMIKKFIVVRGPNCFHAALAFHNPKLPRSPYVNVRPEEGYHRAMINYDELWRVIGRSFYEVNTAKYPLKYGDMIVFFNLPDDWEESMAVNFRWIRHTSTYLFGPYTFSKGSKSPDTPYSVKTIGEEWATWLEYSRNLGVKVFRRNQKITKETLPEDLVDWIY